MTHISGFHTLSTQERVKALSQVAPQNIVEGLVAPPGIDALDRMTENVVGAFSLPLSVITGFIINDRDYSLPMVTEEPSVVAAANAAAALFSRVGGTKTWVDTPVTRAQIVFQTDDVNTATRAITLLNAERAALLQLANDCDPKLVEAGGGAFDINFQTDTSACCDSLFLTINLDVHTADAMGANAVNTMAEALLHDIDDRFHRAFNDLTPPTPLMAILTNASPNRLVRAQIDIPLDALARFKRNYHPSALAQRIQAASQFASTSPERAITHNKGILNGICAHATALGQDTRALEAAAYDYACSSGQHKPLTRWTLHNNVLTGALCMPIVAGFVGGARHASPQIDHAFKLAQIDSYNTLVSTLASIGLAQNFSAIAALVSEGIQAGHMKLHARKAPTTDQS